MAKASLEQCQLYSELAPIDSSFIQVTATSHLTFMWNVKLRKPNSGSLLLGFKIVEASTGKRSIEYMGLLKKIEHIY